MKFLDRIGLARRIEIPTSSNPEVFEQQLMKFKNSNSDRFGFLYLKKFVPSDLKVKGTTFVITKTPRFFWPFTPTGEIIGRLATREQNVIESRIFPMYWLLYFMLFMTTLMGAIGVLISYISGNFSTFFWLWLTGLMLFNVLTYFMLRMNVQYLEQQFRAFMSEEILSEAT